MYHEPMAFLQIRDVPDETRDVLARCAREHGQSLSKYLRDVVMREASFVHNRELIDEVVAHRGASHATAEDVLSAIDSGRERGDV